MFCFTAEPGKELSMSDSRKKIMLVDDNIINLTMGRNVLSDQYDVFTIPSGEKFFALLERITPDLILLDVEMPDMNGYTVLSRLKKMKGREEIPVIFITEKNDTDSELEGLSLGAIDYISKPFLPALLKKRIELHLLVEDQKKELQDYNDNLQHMVAVKTETVVSLQNAVMKTMAELVECRDDITGGHIERIVLYLLILVKAMIERGLCLEQVAEWDKDAFFYQSCQLHDVGKIAIKDSILMKPDKLTPEEFEEMKVHTIFGGIVIDKIGMSTGEKSFLTHAKIFAETHHEKWNGSGYPFGLVKNQIPLQGRLMAIVDVYDALLSERPYKCAFTHDQAVEIIKEGCGTHFDPMLVDVFLSVKDKFAVVPQSVHSPGMYGLVSYTKLRKIFYLKNYI